MGRFADRVRGGDPAEIAAQGLGGLEGGKLAAILSLFALALSGYSLWETSLKQAEVQVFVPPVIQYAAPYQNSNFESDRRPRHADQRGRAHGDGAVDGAGRHRSAHEADQALLRGGLRPLDHGAHATGAYEPFAPLSLAGRSSRTESVLFYTRGDDQKPDQLIHELGPYNFELTFDVAEGGEKPTVKFDRSVLHYDARAFNERTLPLYSADWRSASNTKRAE